jgi:transcriptional regulator with XRE-family HTH domain
MMIGDRVRRLREAKGWSLRDLSKLTGVSAPMLSQVERAETSPTLQVAAKIASGLDMSLSQLLRLDEQPHVSVVRASGRRRVKGNGHGFEELTPALPGQPHSVTVHTLASGAATGDSPLHEPGSRETGVVQTGRLRFICGTETVELGVGDAVTFDADLPHHYEAIEDSTFIAVVTSGLRRA